MTTLPSPPRAPKPSYEKHHLSRWEREKLAAGDEATFEHPEDPKIVGPWIMGELVGKGASGRVKVAKHKDTGKLAAAKIVHYERQPTIDLRDATHKQSLGVEREVAMMKLMEHPNILCLYDVWEHKNDLYLMMEWVEGGELFDFIVNRGRLPALEALSYFKQIIHGLSYCHAFNIAHRDLKPENVLIHGPNNEFVKIADWGMAAVQQPFAPLETSCGSPHYACPEIIRGEPYDGRKADIWSAGIVLYALLAGRLPFDDKNVAHLLSKVKAGKFDMPSVIPSQAADLIRRMLVIDVNERLTLSDIMVHPFMARETPGLYFPPLPSINAVSAPVHNPRIIPHDTKRSLMILLAKHATETEVDADLMQETPNTTKMFYALLLKFKERSMESFNEDDQYGSCVFRPSAKVNMLPIGPQRNVAAPKTQPEPYKRTHRRNHSSPTRNSQSSTVGRPRQATTSGVRPPREVFAPLPNGAHVERPFKEEPANTTISRAGYKPPMRNLSVNLVDPARRPPRPPARRQETSPLVAPSTRVGLGIANAAIPLENRQEALCSPALHPDPAINSIVEQRLATVMRLANREPQGSEEERRPSRLRYTTIASGAPRVNKRAGSLPPVKDNEGPGACAPGSERFRPLGPEISYVPRLRDEGKENDGAIFDSPRGGTPRRTKSRKARPSPLDLSKPGMGGAPTFGSPGPLAPATPIFSPVVDEFRGWFSNLFTWKTPTYILHSSDNLLATRDETRRLLESFGVHTTLEEPELWGMLRCRTDFMRDVDGATFAKQVRFRVEFTPYGAISAGRSAQASSPAIEGLRTANVAPASGTTAFQCTLSLIQEKGALSTFKIVCQRLRAGWRRDALYSPGMHCASPAVDANRSYAVLL